MLSLLFDSLKREFGALAGVGTVFTGAAHGCSTNRRHVAFHASLHFFERWLYPGVATDVWNNFGAELDAVEKAVEIQTAISIDEVACATHLQAVLAHQPLIDFHLALVSYLPIGIDRHFSIFSGGFVVHHYYFAGIVHP